MLNTRNTKLKRKTVKKDVKNEVNQELEKITEPALVNEFQIDTLNGDTILVDQYNTRDGAKIDVVHVDASNGDQSDAVVLEKVCNTPEGGQEKTRVIKKHADYINGSAVDINEIQTSILTQTGTFKCTDEKETDFTNKAGDHLSFKEKHEIKGKINQVPCYQSLEFFPVSKHPLDQFKLGETYNIDNFIGTVPELFSWILTGYYAPAPVWTHKSCALTVSRSDQSGKHLTISAEVDPYSANNPNGTNTYFGISGKYEIEVCLAKKGDGIVCTKIQGKLGILAMPSLITSSLAVASSVANFSRLTTNTDLNVFNKVENYGAGSDENPLELPVILKSNGNGTFQLQINIIPGNLKLDENTYTYMLYKVLYKAGFVEESKLEGTIDMQPVNANTLNQQTGAQQTNNNSPTQPNNSSPSNKNGR